jgi:cysteine desulfurase
MFEMGRSAVATEHRTSNIVRPTWNDSGIPTGGALDCCRRVTGTLRERANSSCREHAAGRLTAQHKIVPRPVYLDHHATTPLDERVLEAMLPCFTERFGNAGSINHSYGWEAQAAVDAARESIAAAIGAEPKEIVFTSGATEANNLAIRGVCEREPRRGGHIVSMTTEHRAVLDPLRRQERRGWAVTLLDPAPHGRDDAGRVSAAQVAAALGEDTALASVMLANNEIGVIQPIAEIGALCRRRGVLVHGDATQAVGKIPVNVDDLSVDLMSFSAHKTYGPKGVGALYVRREGSRVRLQPQIDGGGQEGGLRSGTLNVAGIVGFAKAVEISLAEMREESRRLSALRDRLYGGLLRKLDGVSLNGPVLSSPGLRLPGNLNVMFAGVNGEALMTSLREIAVSSGAACSSANPEPSHVLLALGLTEDQAKASLRFGIGRYNTEQEIDFAVSYVTAAVRKLRGERPA